MSHPETLQFGTVTVPLIWRASPRTRRVSLRLDPKKQALLITYPPTYPLQHILDFLQKQQKWIIARFEKLKSQSFSFLDGNTIPIAGKLYTIQHQPQGRGGAWLDGDTLIVTGQSDFIARRVTDFLKHHARILLTEELRHIAQAAHLTPSKVDIRDTASRWGSCNSAGRIMLSWRLVMAPHPVRHYIIAHELAHLKHMNHSANFWSYTDTLTPHRKQAEAWLKLYGTSLLSAQ